MRALLIGMLFSLCLQGQTDTSHVVRVHFLYGSRPIRKYRSTEPKYFGGIHGGHVTVQVDSTDYGFEPAQSFHVFSHHRRFKSDYVNVPAVEPRYPQGVKAVTFLVPISNAQYQAIVNACHRYADQTPYDYAFFGMRCAASAQDVLGIAGIVRYRKHLYNIVTTFYPKPLRRRMFKLAAKNHYTIIQQQGRPTRKWERD